MLYLITLEPLENRYTAQWKNWIPSYLLDKNIEYQEIDGFSQLNSNTNSTNFLDLNLHDRILYHAWNALILQPYQELPSSV